MDTPSSIDLEGFAYGEHVEQQRSLGYRLLAPMEPESWRGEVEGLARQLQAAPYPDHWPPTTLFCSVLLGDGRRLVAAARYGLADHTASHRRGGLELIGAVAPGSLGVPSALAVYRWLQQRRAASNDLRTLGGRHDLGTVLSAVPPQPLPGDPVPILPIRIWQEGALLFAATNPADPDHRLGLLEQGTASNWQWLPLVGGDFPLPTYAQRGPVIAWSPHLADVAVKLDPPERPPRPANRLLGAVSVFMLLLLLGVNVWALWSLSRQVHSAAQQFAPRETPRPPPLATTDPTTERFAQSLQRLLGKQGGLPEWGQARLDEQYERLVGVDKDLALAGPEGKKVVVTAHMLSKRSAARVEALIREALKDKGYDPRLIELVCERVHENLAAAGEP